MNIILLSGGSGKRLWPLSNEIRSKQFIKIFKKPDGSYESMLQRVYRQIKEINEDSTITIATSKSQASAINNQIGRQVDICVEPTRKDTFPAIALACAYLHDLKGLSLQDVVVVCPVDPYVDNAYFEAVQALSEHAKASSSNVTLLGITPTYPSEKYGYIIPATKEEISSVRSFKEKPDLETAKQYLKENALWNGGVFAFKIGYLLDKSKELLGNLDYIDLFDQYHELPKISFDYGVLEQESSIDVLRFHGAWKDLGTWNTLTEEMSETIIGNALCNDTCENIHIVNELNIPIVCMGLKDLIVSASPDGILISDKTQSSYIKPYVDSVTSRIMFAEKSWGSFTVLDIEDESLTIKVLLNKDNQMNYHSHNFRDEVWTIIEGEASIILDGNKKDVKPGDIIEIKAGMKHTILAKTRLKLIEVQYGKDIRVEDKLKWDL